MSTKVLIVSLYHPEIMRGGAQEVAYELFQAAQRDGDISPMLLCCVNGQTHSGVVTNGATITGFEGRKNEFIFISQNFDLFLQKIKVPIAVGRYLEFLEWTEPEVVHIHHSLFFGMELLTATRRALPKATILYTLHEFIPICLAKGQMVRQSDDQLCSYSSPYRCHECFPDVSMDSFFARKSWMLKHFEVVDTFITPSHHAKSLYVDWGLDEKRVVVIPNGQTNLATEAQSASGPDPEIRNRFAFFGQLVDNKGLHVLLLAVKDLVRQGMSDFSIDVHGANFEAATGSYRRKVDGLIEEIGSLGFKQVQFNGRYSHDDLPRLMSRIDWVVVPSTWWETFGLVVSEAWMFRRPVIASDLGSLRERVTHGKDGLLFPVGDDRALAKTMKKCIYEPSLWGELSSGTQPPQSSDAAWQRHKQLF